MTGAGPSGAKPEDRLPRAERMVAFTDAAVAIALTLLVLPLVELVPEAVHANEPASSVVTHNLVAIGSFLLSFVVIARFWTVHHRLFGFSVRLTPGLVRLNLLWVLTIAVLPFPTEMISSFESDHFAPPFYLSVLLVCSATLSAMTIVMQRTAARDGDEDGVPESFVVGSLASTSTMVAALVVVLIFPDLGAWAFLVLIADPVFEPVIRRLRGDRKKPRGVSG
ncbi:TMEM175 family protein [Actinomycetospora endophytica]|uniref:TMEM175 family protein n=1 Tax=Actinomycetospora endophytica TaxID=2291215 RepID=A0ABS8PEV0_9PSEU|nr:TMEM175 family protein [Actinomycetospora endophytica]MCD2195519.1 TMEM175 family protein [Actinomycetospora endophytica]